MNKKQFWSGISILLNNYHAVNRKLFACEIIKVEAVYKGLQQLKDNVDSSLGHNKKEVEKSFLKSYLQKLVNNDDSEDQIEAFIVHFKCIPKKNVDSWKAMGILNFVNSSFRMTFDNDSIHDFEIRLLSNDIRVISIANNSGLDTVTDSVARWLEFVLKPKFLKWCHHQEETVNLKDVDNEKQSLRLIDNEKYNRLYNLLKEKYSECAMKLWNEAKESTDPLKFIYEDLAIAAYLITLWHSNWVDKSQTVFADLGCGNGLLVYILIREGYQGYGYDVRRRKLWSLYPADVSSHLFEQAIEPFKFNLPNDVNWLIGNHSDELSPWLPVLAATCRKNTNYFLLPCCAFEFSGKRYQRRNSSVSGYSDFCEYAEKISNTCGFKTLKDRLKIPSTKRIALIGLNNVYTENDYFNKTETIKEFVRNEQLEHSNTSLDGIKLREKTEAVRNCTQIEKSIIERLINKIFHLLLEDKTDVESSWQRGGSLRLQQIATALDKEDLKHIKSECGGLKTLLRNKHEIFEFQLPDYVAIRKPQIQTNKSNKPQTVKKRACYFKLNHPQGCPLPDEQCTFIH